MHPTPLSRPALALAGAFIVAQILIPIALVLSADHLPTVFAWQMFARGTPRIEFEVTLDDGHVLVLRPRDVLLKDRVDIPFAEVLPPLLCQRHRAVSVRTITADMNRVHACD